MALLNGKFVLRLLLIVTMVIQPVAIAHAMASMDYTQHHKMFASQQNHDGAHDMHHAALDFEHETQESEGDSVMSDCCNTSACCPAAIVDTYVLPYMPAAAYSEHVHAAWEGVILPSKIKPPKRFFA